jgi:hypothetical protein
MQKKKTSDHPSAPNREEKGHKPLLPMDKGDGQDQNCGDSANRLKTASSLSKAFSTQRRSGFSVARGARVSTALAAQLRDRIICGNIRNISRPFLLS